MGAVNKACSFFESWESFQDESEIAVLRANLFLFFSDFFLQHSEMGRTTVLEQKCFPNNPNFSEKVLVYVCLENQVIKL